MSLDLLGAEDQRGILIRVRNTKALAAQKGGKVAAVAAQIVPETIESVVLDKMVAQFKSNLQTNGVDADVTIVSANAHAPATSGFNMGVVAGMGITAAGYVAWRYAAKRFL